VLTDRFYRQGGGGCDNLGNYCGGTYQGLISQLDYIAGMGFDAIWISPIVDNYEGGYHGYWARDIYALNDRFGSKEDLQALVTACHERGIWVMVDVVGNHMGNTNQDYSRNRPFDSPEHFHDYCIISDQDFQQMNQPRIENCRLAGLADLRQESDWVRTQLLEWVRRLVQ
jgi:alpha-amylase